MNCASRDKERDGHSHPVRKRSPGVCVHTKSPPTALLWLFLLTWRLNHLPPKSKGF